MWVQKLSHVKNRTRCICENGKCLKIIADTSAIVCNKIIKVTVSVSKNMTNTASTNVTRNALINSDNKKVRYTMDCYVLYTFLYVIILLFITAIFC